MKSLYIKLPNAETFKKAVAGAMLSEYMFSFPNDIIPRFETARGWYHKNSKLLLHLFYNDITRRYEMQITTAAIEKSYPQINKVVARDLASVDFKVLRGAFGDYIPSVYRG